MRSSLYDRRETRNPSRPDPLAGAVPAMRCDGAARVLISVVIPTLGRASLRTATKSAIEQSIPVSEILVINDSGTMLDGLHEPRVRIIDTPGGLGAAAKPNYAYQGLGKVT